MDKTLIEFSALSHSRRASLRTVLRSVIEGGPISRAELSRRTGLSKQTMSEIVRNLVEEGWLSDVGQHRGGIGRSATTYELNRQRAYVWGGDLGGTRLRIAIADLAGQVVAEANEATAAAGGGGVVGQIVGMTRRLSMEAGVRFDRIACGALGVPGAYDRRNGRLELVSNIAGIEALNLEEALSDRLGMRTFVENDVTLAAKGELWRGNPRETGTFVFLAMGTGVGLGVISEGTIIRGAAGAAGEIAWLPLGGDPFDSRNLRNGTLENAVSSRAILGRYRAVGGADDATMIDLFDRLNAGERAAHRCLDEVARVLGTAVLAIGAVLDPEAVIFGGSIGARAELLDLIRENLARCVPRPIPLEIGRLGARAGQVGAIKMAMEHVHETLCRESLSPVKN